MSKRRKAFEWIEPLKLLAQDLAVKTPEMKEYAGLDEKSALLVAKINSLIEIIPTVYPHLKPLIPLLKLKKKIVMHEGHAKWVSNASELTNLGLLVPKKTVTLDVKKEMEKDAMPMEEEKEKEESTLN